MSAIPLVSEQEFEQAVLNCPLPVLVEFGAKWCGPCKTVAPELEALRSELKGKAEILQVDIDDCPRIAQAMRVQSVPTFIVFVAGRPADAGQGAMNRAQLRQLLDKHLPRATGALTAPEAAQLLLNNQLTPVDTRDEPTFKRTHIEKAVNFPLVTLGDRLGELQLLSPPAMLYCRDGKDSMDMAGKLAAQGYPVSFLDGGVLEWEGAGNRLVRPPRY